MLHDLVVSGRLIDFILVLVAAEAVAIYVLHRLRGGLALTNVAPMLLSGTFLLIALRLALTDAEPAMILVCLTGAFLAHIADLARR